MRRHLTLLAGCAGALIMAHPSAAQAPLEAAMPALVANHTAERVGAAPSGMPMHVLVSLPLHNEAALDFLIRQIYTPGSPQYRQYLSVADYTRLFGPTEAEYQSAAHAFARPGLRVTADAPNRFLIQIDGQAGDIARAFHVTFGAYRNPADGRVFHAPDQEPRIDTGVPVLNIIGLDDGETPRPRLIKSPDGSGRLAGSGSGPGGNFTGTDIRAAYYGAGPLTGAGQSIGLMELGPFNPAGPQAFFHTYGPVNSVKIQAISTDKSPVSCTACDDSEQDLDIEYAVAVAPGLAKVQVYVAQRAESALNRMATDNTSKQLSTSWGWGKTFATDDKIFKQMAVQGQTMLSASGDYSSLAASGEWPEEDANITAVGGTHLDTTGPAGAWVAESGWSGSAGGPSLDKTIRIPTYQKPFITSANKGSTRVRNVPDVAAAADYQFTICDTKGCSTGWGGTSFASPIWAGVIALANQKARIDRKPPIGFLNPTIYGVAAKTTYPQVFHDVTLGASGFYSCTPSFDLVTGVGSPIGAPLISALNAP